MFVENFVERINRAASSGVGLYQVTDNQKEELFQAVREGQVEKAAQLLQEGAASLLQEECSSLLWIAVEKRGAAMVALLLKRSGTVGEMKNARGESLVHVAVKQDNIEIVRLLIAHGATAAGAKEDGETPLHYAVFYSSYEMMELLLKNGAGKGINAQGGKNGATPLIALVSHMILAKSPQEVQRRVQLLLENGADINARNGRNEFALLYAVRLGNLGLVKTMLAAGAKTMILASSDSGFTPFHAAVLTGSTEMVECLLREAKAVPVCVNGRESPLGMAVRRGALPIAMLLIDFYSIAERALVAKTLPSPDASNLVWLQIAILFGNPENIQNYLEKQGKLSLQETVKTLLFVIRNCPKSVSEETQIKICDLVLRYGDVAALTFASDTHDPVLFTAIRCQLRLLTRHLLGLGASSVIGYSNRFGWTPLHLATYYCDWKMVQLVLTSGGHRSVNHRNADGNTPFHYAVRQGSTMMMSVLLNYAKYESIEDAQGMTPFHLAAFHDRYDICAQLIKHVSRAEAEKVNDVNSQRRGTLVDVALTLSEGFLLKELLVLADSPVSFDSERKIKTLRYIIRMANVELLRSFIPFCHLEELNHLLEDGEQNTVLHEAAEQGNFEIVQLLLRRGADPSLQNQRGETYIQSVTDPLVKMMLEAIGPEEIEEDVLDRVIQEASEKNLFNYIMKLLPLVPPSGINKERGGKGKTLLRFAASSWDHFMLVKILLDRGAETSINIQDEKGMTPFLSVIKNDDSSLISRFLERGADLNITCNDGWNALHYAMRYACASNVKLLLTRKEIDALVHLHTAPPDYLTPLQLLCYADLENSKEWQRKMKATVTEKVELLLAHGAGLEINERRNPEGRTALYCSMRSPPRVIQLLLEHGADVHCLDRSGFSPLQVCAVVCNHAVLPLLLQAGAFREINCDATGFRYGTPLHHALYKNEKFKGTVETVQLLLYNGAYESLVIHNHNMQTPRDVVMGSGLFSDKEKKQLTDLLDEGMKMRSEAHQLFSCARYYEHIPVSKGTTAEQVFPGGILEWHDRFDGMTMEDHYRAPYASLNLNAALDRAVVQNDVLLAEKVIRLGASLFYIYRTSLNMKYRKIETILRMYDSWNAACNVHLQHHPEIAAPLAALHDRLGSVEKQLAQMREDSPLLEEKASILRKMQRLSRLVRELETSSLDESYSTAEYLVIKAFREERKRICEIDGEVIDIVRRIHGTMAEYLKHMFQKAGRLLGLLSQRGSPTGKVVEEYIRDGADVNAVDAHNMTPLMLARRYGHTEAEQVLLKRGATLLEV